MFEGIKRAAWAVALDLRSKRLRRGGDGGVRYIAVQIFAFLRTLSGRCEGLVWSRSDIRILGEKGMWFLDA